MRLQLTGDEIRLHVLFTLNVSEKQLRVRPYRSVSHLDQRRALTAV
jgi:hypothetical protein